MHGNKKDKRSIRTRAAIESSLLHLLNEYSLDNISIKQLCAEADINRTTFYLHYSSVFDVLDNIRTEFINEILECYNSLHIPSGAESYTAFLKAVHEVTVKRPRLESFIIGSKEASVFTEGLKNSLYERIYGALARESREEKREHCVYATAFLCSGVIDSYILWLKNNKSAPFEVLCECCGALIKTGHACFMRTSENRQ